MWLFLGVFQMVSCIESTGYSSSFDHTHAVLDRILRKYVEPKGGESYVNYKELTQDQAPLENYINTLMSVTRQEFESFNEKQKLAFLINAYNVFTIKLVLNHYPVESIKDIPRAWDEPQFLLLEKRRSLNEIENVLIRKKFNEPRIHFALVCGAQGCPALRDGAYTEAELEEQLDQAAFRFLNDKSRNRIDIKTGKLYLSPIFKWYEEDFNKNAGSVAKFIAPYVSSDKATSHWLRSENPQIVETEYIWKLNDVSQAPTREIPSTTSPPFQSPITKDNQYPAPPNNTTQTNYAPPASTENGHGSGTSNYGSGTESASQGTPSTPQNASNPSGSNPSSRESGKSSQQSAPSNSPNLANSGPGPASSAERAQSSSNGGSYPSSGSGTEHPPAYGSTSERASGGGSASDYNSIPQSSVGSSSERLDRSGISGQGQNPRNESNHGPGFSPSSFNSSSRESASSRSPSQNSTSQIYQNRTPTSGDNIQHTVPTSSHDRSFSTQSTHAPNSDLNSFSNATEAQSVHSTPNSVNISKKQPALTENTYPSEPTLPVRQATSPGKTERYSGDTNPISRNPSSTSPHQRPDPESLPIISKYSAEPSKQNNDSRTYQGNGAVIAPPPETPKAIAQGINQTVVPDSNKIGSDSTMELEAISKGLTKISNEKFAEPKSNIKGKKRLLAVALVPMPSSESSNKRTPGQTEPSPGTLLLYLDPQRITPKTAVDYATQVMTAYHKYLEAPQGHLDPRVTYQLQIKPIWVPPEESLTLESLRHDDLHGPSQPTTAESAR